MISLDNKSLCCGCATCKIVCPTHCISMAIDDEGFVYPKIDNSSCVNCNLCEKNCPVLNHSNEIDLQHEVYIALAKDARVRFDGSSGGMFGLIAQHIIEQDGIVYGAAFDDDLKLKCTSAQTFEELKPLYKSKYIQSDLSDSFVKIKKQLEENIQVLFVSTPCQVYALKLFLKKEYDNLLTVDFVCHGVPSQSFFDKCKDYVEKKENIIINDYGFRSKKKNGATPHYYTLKYHKNGKTKQKTSLYIKSPFYLGFQKYITLRDSCYDCRFSFSNRVSDITIGDFHEVDKYIDGINRFDGVSSLVVNSEKGRKIWSYIKSKTIYYPLDFKLLIENKEFMCGATKKPEERDAFLKSLATEDFDVVVKKYLNDRKMWVKKIYYYMPRFMRKIMKRIILR